MEEAVVVDTVKLVYHPMHLVVAEVLMKAPVIAVELEDPRVIMEEMGTNIMDLQKVIWVAAAVVPVVSVVIL
jgi:hypothetical protein